MPWSHSRLETYENCPRKFKYRYIDKIESTVESVHAFMGSRVHQVLEGLYESVHLGKIPPLDKLWEDYSQLWESEKKIPLAIPEGKTEDDFRSLGKRCIENYYARYQPFNQDITLGIEEMITVEIEDKFGPIKIVGFVDRISRKPDGTVGIHDYKTGKMKSQASLDYDRQLALYQIGLKQKWPDMERFELVWHYLAYAEEFKSRRSPEQLEYLKRNIAGIVRQIESDTVYEPKKSALCNYCEFQPICPLWKHLHELQSVPAKERAAVPAAQLVDLYGDLKNTKKIIETQIEETEEQLRACLSDEPKQALFGTRWKVAVSRTEGIQLPPKGKPERKRIEEILKGAGFWGEISGLDTNAVKKIIASGRLDPETSSAVEPLVGRETSCRFTLGKVSEPVFDEEPQE